jgi:hypothetical protein
MGRTDYSDFYLSDPQQLMTDQVNQHSKIIVGLLLAATIAVDLMVANWLREMGPESRIVYVYEALATAQLAAVTIWAVLGAGPALAKWIAVAAVVVLSAFATARLEGPEITLVEMLGINACFVSLLAFTLWVLKQTRFWQRLNGAATESPWRFSMSQLLIVTTVVALLITAMRQSFVFAVGDMWKSYMLLTMADIVLVTGTIIAWRWARSMPQWFPIWIPRWGVVTAVAMVVGFVETLATLSGLLGESFAADLARAKFDLMAYTLIAAFVVFLYLELTPILRVGRPAEESPPDGAATE